MNRDRISKEIEETYAKEPKTFAMKLGERALSTR